MQADRIGERAAGAYAAGEPLQHAMIVPHYPDQMQAMPSAMSAPHGYTGLVPLNPAHLVMRDSHHPFMPDHCYDGASMAVPPPIYGFEPSHAPTSWQTAQQHSAPTMPSIPQQSQQTQQPPLISSAPESPSLSSFDPTLYPNGPMWSLAHHRSSYHGRRKVAHGDALPKVTNYSTLLVDELTSCLSVASAPFATLNARLVRWYCNDTETSDTKSGHVVSETRSCPHLRLIRTDSKRSRAHLCPSVFEVAVCAESLGIHQTFFGLFVTPHGFSFNDAAGISTVARRSSSCGFQGRLFQLSSVL